MLLKTSGLDRPDAVVLAVGAHADDIEIGAAGTILRLRQDHPDLTVVSLVMCAEGARRAEAHAGASALGVQRVYVEDFPDRFLPSHREALKHRIAAIATEVSAEHGPPTLVIGPWRHDRHQDHHTLGELLWQQFRSQPIWAYEIVKYEDDLGHPNVLVTLTEEQVARKVGLLLDAFPSQQDKAWFDEACFRALMRLRGIHGGTGWAEAFHVEKMIL